MSYRTAPRNTSSRSAPMSSSLKRRLASLHHFAVTLWVKDLPMFYQLEEALFIFCFTASAEPCQRIAAANMTLNLRLLVFFWTVSPPERLTEKQQKKPLTENTARHWNLIFSHLSPGLIKSIPNSTPHPPKCSEPGKQFCTTGLAAHALICKFWQLFLL